MPEHHPGTAVHRGSIDPNEVPRSLTTHLLSINNDQLMRITSHPFLEQAAHGTLPKELVVSWLTNDALYLHGFLNLIDSVQALLQQIPQPPTKANDSPTIEASLMRLLQECKENGQREANFFKEVAQIYNYNLPTSLAEESKCEGLRQFEKIFATTAQQQPQPFIPWLEGIVALWATEKVYFESWSWSKRQMPAGVDRRSYGKDADGGAMRTELIDNWSNSTFRFFVSQLEHTLNRGVSDAVARDDARWQEVFARVDPIWRAVLDAEEAFWPDMPGFGSQTTKALNGVASVN